MQKNGAETYTNKQMCGLSRTPQHLLQSTHPQRLDCPDCSLSYVRQAVEEAKTQERGKRARTCNISSSSAYSCLSQRSQQCACNNSKAAADFLQQRKLHYFQKHYRLIQVYPGKSIQSPMSTPLFRDRP